MVIGLLLVVLFTGLPVAFSLGSTSVLLIFLNNLPKIVSSTMLSGLESFTLLAVPLFILMSQILLDGRVGDDLFEVMNAWVRHLPGRPCYCNNSCLCLLFGYNRVWSCELQPLEWWPILL